MTWCAELQEGRGICSGPQRRENDFAISSKRIPDLLRNCVSGIRPSAVLYFGGTHGPTGSLPCTPRAGSLSGAQETQTQQNGHERDKVPTLCLPWTRSLRHHGALGLEPTDLRQERGTEPTVFDEQNWRGAMWRGKART